MSVAAAHRKHLTAVLLGRRVVFEEQYSKPKQSRLTNIAAAPSEKLTTRKRDTERHEQKQEETSEACFSRHCVGRQLRYAEDFGKQDRGYGVRMDHSVHLYLRTWQQKFWLCEEPGVWTCSVHASCILQRRNDRTGPDSTGDLEA